MAAQGLVARPKRGRRGLTRQGTRPAAPDLVDRKFVAEAPDRLWCGDLTVIDTDEGKLYLLVTWNHAAGWSLARRRYHELRGRVACVDGADGEMAGSGSA